MLMCGLKLINHIFINDFKITKMKKEELISLNSELSELYVEELEQRLETDPLAVGGLLDLASSSDPTLLSTNITGCDKTCNGFQIG